MFARLIVPLVVFTLAGLAVAVGVVAQEGDISARGSAATGCPFRYRADFDDYELPERMSRAQVEACRRYFAAQSPDGRFAPGARSFTSQFCNRFVVRDYASREAECQDVRVAVCRLAVRDARFPNVRSCFIASPGQRVQVRRRLPRLSVFVSEPALFDGLWLDFTDNTLDRWFPDGGRAEFYEPRRQAWDPRSARVVPFPDDLVAFIAANPYVRVVGTRDLRYGRGTGRQIDVFVREGDPGARKESLCGEYGLRDDPCVPISADPSSEGYVSLALSPRRRYRLVDLRTPSGRIIVVIDGFDRFTQLMRAERMLRTLRDR